MPYSEDSSEYSVQSNIFNLPLILSYATHHHFDNNNPKQTHTKSSLLQNSLPPRPCLWQSLVSDLVSSSTLVKSWVALNGFMDGLKEVPSWKRSHLGKVRKIIDSNVLLIGIWQKTPWRVPCLQSFPMVSKIIWLSNGSMERKEPFKLKQIQLKGLFQTQSPILSWF